MLLNALVAAFFALLFSICTISKPIVPLPKAIYGPRLPQRDVHTPASSILSPRQVTNNNCTVAGEAPRCDSNPQFAAAREPCLGLLAAMKFHDSVRPAGSRTIDNCWISWDERPNINPTYGDLIKAVSGMLDTCWKPDVAAQSARIPLISIDGNCTALCISNRPEGCLI